MMPKTTSALADFSANTLFALHHALVSLRALAYQGTEPRTLGRMLDDIEYIGVLAMQSRTDDNPERIENFGFIEQQDNTISQ